jgi:RNA polymerase primary sigma factor
MSTRARGGSQHASTLQVYLREINETGMLSRAEEGQLAERIAAGDPTARDRMVRANLRLVVHLARGYLGRGLPLEDLIAEGNLGLIRAAEGYDATKDVRFSTYASYWIKQSIRGALRKAGDPIRLPAYMVNLLVKWRRASRELAERLGREPAPHEVGRALKLSPKRLAMAVRALEVASLTAVSETREDEESGRFPAAMADERARSAEARVIEADELGRLVEGMACLGGREARVIRLRFGLGTDRPMTLQEVGGVLGLTRERVRQIEKEGMQRLESSLRGRSHDTRQRAVEA